MQNFSLVVKAKLASCHHSHGKKSDLADLCIDCYYSTVFSYFSPLKHSFTVVLCLSFHTELSLNIFKNVFFSYILTILPPVIIILQILLHLLLLLLLCSSVLSKIEFCK